MCLAEKKRGLLRPFFNFSDVVFTLTNFKWHWKLVWGNTSRRLLGFTCDIFVEATAPTCSYSHFRNYSSFTFRTFYCAVKCFWNGKNCNFSQYDSLIYNSIHTSNSVLCLSAFSYSFEYSWVKLLQAFCTCKITFFLFQNKLAIQ